jgi:multimeric flavodoxin WrbA
MQFEVSTLKAILLYGSPRKKGNTFQIGQLVNKCLEKYHIESKEVIVGQLKGSNCIGCNYCMEHDRCIYQDNFSDVINEISSADIIVIASPVYFGGVTAQMKALIDRMQVLYNNKHIITGNKAILCISTAAEKKISVFDGIKRTIRYLSYIFSAFDTQYILVNDVLNIKSIEDLVDKDTVINCVDNIIKTYKPFIGEDLNAISEL